MSDRPLHGSGIVLILVSVLLVLLTGSAMVCVRAMGGNRLVTGQRVQAARAGLLARSGAERGWQAIRRGEDPTYGGENWDGDAPPALDAGVETDAQTWRPVVLDMDCCPAECALRPSLFASSGVWRDPLGRRAPDRTAVDGKERGFTGRLRGTHIDRSGLRGDTYALRVLTGGIYVNDGDPAVAYDPGLDDYNRILHGVLGTLAEALDREDGIDDGRPVDAADGRALIEQRPPAGWRSYEEIRTVALGGDALKRDILRPYLTLRSWVDRKVVAPNAPAAMNGVAYTSWSDVKNAHDTVPGGEGRAPGMERIGGRVVGRAPVDLAWARNRRVALVSLLAGISTVYFDEYSQRSSQDDDRVGIARIAGLPLDWAQPTDACRSVADAIVAHAGPLDTWERWDAFCDGLVTSGVLTGATQEEKLAKADLLKVHFNPNTRSNKFNPSESFWRRADKSDLQAYTTEFSLFSCSPVRMESIGRVTDAGGRLLALHRVAADFPCPTAVRLTTQREFVCRDLGDPEVAGDETGVRLPGEAGFLSEGREADRTWGHRLASAGWMDGDSQGTGIQTYPEPYADAGSGLTMQPASYDGYLTLSTIETATGEFYGVGSPTRVQTMLGRYDDDLDLDVAGGDPVLRPDTLQAPVGNALWNPSRPGCLCPDGVISEISRAPAYAGAGNTNGYHGVVSFWYRPNTRPWWNVMRGHALLEMHNYGPPNRQFFCLVDRRNALSVARYGFLFEIGHQVADTNMEHEFGTATNAWLAREWRLVTLFWDSQAAGNSDATGELIVHLGDRLGRVTGSQDAYYDLNVPASAEDLTANLGVPHVVVLGRRDMVSGGGSMTSLVGSGADATFDEFAIYDFGQDEMTAPVLADARYKRGRYYRGWKHRAFPQSPVDGEAAAVVTPTVALPAGTRIERVQWTWHRPRALASDYAEVEILEPAGTSYLWDADADAPWARSRSTGGAAGWPVERQEWIVGREIPGAFRLRVLFRRPGDPAGDPLVDPLLDDNTPILESPILDDLTVVYGRPGAPRLASWSEG